MVAGSRENIPGSKIFNNLGDLGDPVGTSGDLLITELRLGTLGTRLGIYNIIYLQKVPILFFHHYIYFNRIILPTKGPHTIFPPLHTFQHCMGEGVGALNCSRLYTVSVASDHTMSNTPDPI